VVTTARSFARALLAATTVDGKLLAPPVGLELDDDGAPELVAAPGRPPGLAIQPGRKVAVPPVAGMRDPAQRARILHALANHELQAAELFAWALLAFPDAPRPFRAGLLGILADEQRHAKLYLERLAAHGAAFGDHPVTGHFWHKLEQMATPLGFVCAMGLTFENANLDFAGDYARAARAAGDEATAAVLDRVHDDEIGHVRFAWTWLGKLAPGKDPWAAYTGAVSFPLGPHRARGKDFDAEARRRAGISDDFIARLAAVLPTRPSGEPR
jgi:uncharacterized ferritin-like protein (DUF455 family)